VPGDKPQYLDDAGPTCRGLVGPPEVPFPYYRDGSDGYRDGQPVDPKTGRSQGPPPSGQGPDRTYPSGTRTNASATPFSPASFDRDSLSAVVAPVLHVGRSEVPDVALLLFGPVARGTKVSLT